MTDSLRDQLLGLGFKAAPAPAKPEKRNDRPGGKSGAPRRDERRPAGKGGRPDARPADRRGAPPRKPRSQEEIDLGKAYALRAQREKDERIAAEAARQEEARLRREARAKLSEFLKDKSLNDKDAEIARHFPYGGKIKRIYVNAEQLRALNAGELGVVQLDGRYVLVTAQVLGEAEAIFAQAVALRVHPNAPASDDPYSDPQYQIPDDLVW
ncbi:DUF2058 family protein [Lysobacter sp. TY2-98]|uniref:DUF2058 domain-containing protein n=1 Tax=Lysobacter sp. TY2-98 TaxID=2290922 RepID=UPI000E2014D3|nr:DUF2058 family protein [Lysobacter sp. TY2-98]AXK71866.1 DUF2058 family protein [Lysobacter sp. TY2-98]